MTIHALFTCGRCGGPGRPVDLELNDVKQDTIHACSKCLAECEEELAEMRPVFDALIKAGVPRVAANAMMVTLGEHPEWTAEVAKRIAARTQKAGTQ